MSALENQLFELKFIAKNLEKSAVRCEKQEKLECGKIKTALTKGNADGARIHAENAIRNKNQALSLRKMAARVDAVASRVQTAVAYKQLTGNMSSVVRSMTAAGKSMQLEKLVQLMDSFEKNFENLDVQSQVMDQTIGNTVAVSVPESEVAGLLDQAAEEAGIDLNEALPRVSTTATSVSAVEEDDLTKRLARLRQG